MDDSTIGLNSCCHYELSFIKQNKNIISFPYYYLEDYYIDFFEDLKITYTNKDDKVYVNSNDISWEELYMLKTESYSASIWYPYLEKHTYKSILIPIENLEDIKSLLVNISFPKFIKLDSVSCKDVSKGIFNNAEEVYETFKKSNRVLNTLTQIPLIKRSHYLFVREVDANINDSIEVRCFIYLSKLVAVSSCTKLNEFQKGKLECFVSNIIKDIPYKDSVIDLAIHNDNLILIEVNNFGADSPAGAGLFNWKEDYFILYGGMTGICYRFPS